PPTRPLSRLRLRPQRHVRLRLLRVRLETPVVANIGSGRVTNPRAILQVSVRCIKWLAIGLVITVAVSWGLAAWIPQRGWARSFALVPVNNKANPAPGLA